MQVEMTYVDNFLKFIFVSSCRHCNFMASNYQPITMQDFVHLHVHTQYSLLDGQASVSALVDKAMKDGMKGIAVTDHGNMFAIKEFTNYVNKKNGGPKGEYSERTLQITKDIGYTTVFWSMAYLDYDVNNQPGRDYVIEHFQKYIHPGAIPLIHNISKSNAEALDTVLTNLEKEGYTFHSLSDLKKG